MIDTAPGQTGREINAMTKPFRLIRSGLFSALVAAATLSGAMPASAQSVLDDGGSRWRFLIGGGATYGGDRLATNISDDGYRQTVRAGRLVQIYAGVQVRLAPAWHASLTGGYHVESAGSYYGSARFSRYPVELLTHFQPGPGWRFGGGLRATFSPSLVGSGDAAFLSEEFKDALSPVLEVEFLPSWHQGIKLRYVRERFKSEIAAPDVRADHFGLMLTWYF